MRKSMGIKPGKSCVFSLDKYVAISFIIIMLIASLAGCIGWTGDSGADVTPGPVRASSDDYGYRYITDMRGVQVKVPEDIKRVATIDDGFVEGVLTNLSEIDKIVAIGSWSLKKDYSYTYPTINGTNYSYTHGWNTMKYLHPWLNETPCINSPQGNIVSYETLADVSPDVVIMRVGDCTVGASDEETITKTISTIESLGIPILVLYSPSYYQNSDLSTMRDEMRVIGQLFGKEQKAMALADYLESTEKMIRERTRDIPDNKKSTVLYIGLSPNARSSGGAGTVTGTDTPESYIIENISNGRNVYRDTGSGKLLNAEQVLALDPDVILLPTSNGFHPPRELYEAPYYQNLQNMRAILNKRVYAMPWTPMNCARRTEYPIDIMIIAKACYPDLFSDIKVHEFVLDFYQDVYGVNRTTAQDLRSNQWLDWTVESDF